MWVCDDCTEINLEVVGSNPTLVNLSFFDPKSIKIMNTMFKGSI